VTFVNRIAALCLAWLFAAPAWASPPEILRADALWELRAEGQREGRAQPQRTGPAIAAYEAALAAHPELLEAHWKLLRALWYSAYFATDQAAVQREICERALAVSERGFAVLAARAGGAKALADASPEDLRARLSTADHRDAAEFYFWYGVNLGAWSRIAGLLHAVRTGVANHLHDATLRSIALDPGVEQGGAIRLLSRLHSELPRLPLISGWVDPTHAVPLAERAEADYPQHPGNAYLLGLALLAHAPERRAEALARIEATVALAPRPDQLVEDLGIQKDARELLEVERGRIDRAHASPRRASSARPEVDRRCEPS
jgi:hypothetical protein